MALKCGSSDWSISTVFQPVGLWSAALAGASDSCFWCALPTLFFFEKIVHTLYLSWEKINLRCQTSVASHGVFFVDLYVLFCGFSWRSVEKGQVSPFILQVQLASASLYVNLTSSEGFGERWVILDANLMHYCVQTFDTNVKNWQQASLRMLNTSVMPWAFISRC